MKFPKKILALLLVLALTFGISLTSFAATPGEANLTITYSGNTITQQYTTLPGVLRTNMPSNAENQTSCTAADIILKYATDNSVAIVSNWDTYNVNPDNTIGMYISSFYGLAPVNNYQLLNYNPYTGKYTYKWTGSYWQLSINGSPASYYATHYPIDLSVGMDISFDYIVDNVGYTFQTTYPIP